jgi:hypothetical protein
VASSPQFPAKMTMLSVAARAVSDVVLIVAQVFARAPCSRFISIRAIDVQQVLTVGDEPKAIKKVAAYRADPLFDPMKMP